MKMNRNEKENMESFKMYRQRQLHSVIFFTKFDLYNSTFESLFSQIIRTWKLFFRSVEAYFSCMPTTKNRSSAQQKQVSFIYRCIPGRKSRFLPKTWKHVTQKNYHFCLSFVSKSRTYSGRLILIKNLYYYQQSRFFVQQKCPSEISSSYAWQSLLCRVEASC